VKPGKLKRSDDAAQSKALHSYVSLFANLEDATAFESAALKTKNEFLPPCARVVRDGGAPTAVYWRWLAAQAEAWS
jgi:hypothetical protein